MFVESTRADCPTLQSRSPITSGHWGVDSEYGTLTEVMLCAPSQLAPVPCCSVTIDSLRRGFKPSAERAVEQHRALVAAIESKGVRCRIVPSMPGLPDLAFARDTTFMTPWGLLKLAPGVGHRREEADHVADTARSWGVPMVGTIEEGTVEGGDICLLKPGLAVIGCSEDRTTTTGAAAVSAFFERQGWRTHTYRFDPHFLHLDTQFAMLDEKRALACVDVLDDAFLEFVRSLGIELIPVTYKEVMKLGANVLSLGGGRIVAAAGNRRVNAVLERLGYEVIAVELDQFTRCGGGVHCLTMPLARKRKTASESFAAAAQPTMPYPKDGLASMPRIS